VTNPTNPTSTYRAPSASSTRAHTGVSSKINAPGMRTMPVCTRLENTDNTLPYTHTSFR